MQTKDERMQEIRKNFANEVDPETLKLIEGDTLEAAYFLLKQFYTDDEWEEFNIEAENVGESLYSITEYSDQGDLNHLIIHYILPAMVEFKNSIDGRK